MFNNGVQFAGLTPRPIKSKIFLDLYLGKFLKNKNIEDRQNVTSSCKRKWLYCILLYPFLILVSSCYVYSRNVLCFKNKFYISNLNLTYNFYSWIINVKFFSSLIFLTFFVFVFYNHVPKIWEKLRKLRNRCNQKRNINGIYNKQLQKRR